jgi:hypothetical protein
MAARPVTRDDTYRNLDEVPAARRFARRSRHA